MGPAADTLSAHQYVNIHGFDADAAYKATAAVEAAEAKGAQVHKRLFDGDDGRQDILQTAKKRQVSLIL